MASNSFGQIFRITTWGESHGPAIGVVVDGCPAGLELSVDDIENELALRAPGNSPYTSPRKEPDKPQLLSGVFEGKTTGAPISILIQNKGADSSKHEPVKEIFKPGHAHFAYLEKYGIFDYRGGGRASARETACRVAAGAIAKKFLKHYGIEIVAYIKQIGAIEAAVNPLHESHYLRSKVYASPVYCPDGEASAAMVAQLLSVMEEGDSLGGTIECAALSLPSGLGDPVYEKLEANLAKAMMSLPATKAFEIGAGRMAAAMQGSQHNDSFESCEGAIRTTTNHAGGTLGGISTGMPLICRVAFKPTSSIGKVQESVTVKGEKAIYELPQGSRNDPCVAIRAVPIVEAMVALVLADAILLNRCSKL